jgi:glycosyltransferase involved in cell wall biosynthesis
MSVTQTGPAVSVVIPAHNSAAFVAEAVESVLAQTFRDYEIIVVDDGSTDHTDEVLRRFGGAIRSHCQPNQGPAAARNAGIGLARGALVCFLDADDVWTSDKLARQVDFMTQHPEIGLLFTDATEWSGDVIQKPSILATMAFGADARSQVPLQGAFRKLLIENFIPTSSVMIRKDCFPRAGLFDVALPNAEDRDMWLRLAAHFPIACLPQVLARKRSHDANISLRTEIALRSRIHVWQQCRQRFPALAPAALCNQLFAITYQQLGYILLEKGEGKDARRCAVASLSCAIRGVASTASPFPYRWFLTIALIPLSFVRWRVVRVLMQARKALRSRNTTPAAAV